VPNRVVVLWRAGPTWTSGGVREQPLWDEHAEFIDALIENGTFVMGGPFADNSGSMSLLEGVTVDEARQIIAKDPFVENGVFVLDDLREWNVFVTVVQFRAVAATPRPRPASTAHSFERATPFGCQA
jgi:uncharacterized protein YciI